MTIQFSVKDANGSEVIGSLEDLGAHLLRTAKQDYADEVFTWADKTGEPTHVILNGSEPETWVRSTV